MLWVPAFPFAPTEEVEVDTPPLTSPLARLNPEQTHCANNLWLMQRSFEIKMKHKDLALIKWDPIKQ